MNPLGTITPKDPADVDLYIIDFRRVFIDPDNIVSFTTDSSPAGLTIVASKQVGPQIQILVGGGVSGVTYDLGATATGTLPQSGPARVIRRSIPVPVRKR